MFDSFYNTPSPNKDMPPDQLLKTLMQILGDTTHPIRKHPQIFPMFARISKQAVVVRAPLVASQDIIDPEQMAESIRELMKPRRVGSLRGFDVQMMLIYWVFFFKTVTRIWDTLDFWKWKKPTFTVMIEGFHFSH